MNSKMRITLSKRIDRADITAILAIPDSMNITVINEYYGDGSADAVIDLGTLSSARLEAFCKVIDNSTYSLEAGALIWKIKLASKTFTLDSSYVRDRLATDGTLTAIPDGTPLKVRFEIPGFETATYREIDLWYNTTFNPTDVASLLDIGIVLTGDGSEFTIDNSIECKVSFRKPTGTTDAYVIDYADAGTIITV
jgi:hypothetical protein